MLLSRSSHRFPATPKRGYAPPRIHMKKVPNAHPWAHEKSRSPANMQHLGEDSQMTRAIVVQLMGGGAGGCHSRHLLFTTLSSQSPLSSGRGAQMPVAMGRKRSSFFGWLTLNGNPSQQKKTKGHCWATGCGVGVFQFTSPAVLHPEVLCDSSCRQGVTVRGVATSAHRSIGYKALRLCHGEPRPPCSLKGKKTRKNKHETKTEKTKRRKQNTLNAFQTAEKPNRTEVHRPPADKPPAAPHPFGGGAASAGEAQSPAPAEGAALRAWNSEAPLAASHDLGQKPNRTPR